MPIINSILISATPQQDGTISVHEQHVDHNGKTYDHVGFISGSLIPSDVMTERAINMGLEVDRREAILIEATNFEIPLDPVDVMGRLTPSEWNAFQMSDNIDIKYIKSMFDKSSKIYRTNPLTIAAKAALLQSGILSSQARADEVFA